MDRNAKHGLILGAIVGASLTAFYCYHGGNLWFGIILIPIGALLGAGPWLVLGKED